MPSVPWSVESSKIFKKIKKKFKIPKMPKIVLKIIQTSFEQVLGRIFLKNFCPVFHGVRSLQKFSKKSKKISKFQKCPKSFPKVSKRVLNVFWGNFFEKFYNFMPSVPWRLKSSKIFKKNQKNFKIPKMPKIVPKSIQTCFERVLGRIFRKSFAQFSMECRVFETFRKKSKKLSKFQPKTHKTVPKRIPKCFEHVLGRIFRKNF